MSATVADVAAAASSSPPVPAPLAFLSAHISDALCAGWLPVQLPYVDECKPSLATALVAITLAPLIWNLLGRLEYYTGALSSIFMGRRSGCVVLAAWIFLFSLYRDALVLHAIQEQPTLAALDGPIPHAIAGVFALVGGTFVLTSFARLGLFGTYLGDYFGILMDEVVSGFPFNVVEHPMYDGSTLLFLSMAIMCVPCPLHYVPPQIACTAANKVCMFPHHREKSAAGLALAVWVFTVYRLACIFEGCVCSIPCHDHSKYVTN